MLSRVCQLKPRSIFYYSLPYFWFWTTFDILDPEENLEAGARVGAGAGELDLEDPEMIEMVIKGSTYIHW